MRLSLILTSLVLLFPLSVTAQKAPTQAQVQEPVLRAHLAFLADDLLEGRGTGQRGGDLTVRYLETQAALIGLTPLNPTSLSPFRHSVKLVGSQTLSNSRVSFELNGKSYAPQIGPDILIGSSNGQAQAIINAPMVFVGYGIKAEEENWDDYKGVDLKGKLLVVLANDPQPTKEAPNRFGGAAMTYYGRWMYKFEEAARRGAAGVLIIHTTASAGYGWNVSLAGYTHERFSLVGGGNALEGWWKEESARAFFESNSIDLDALRAKAELADFRPIDLPARARIQIHNAVREIEQFNIIGMVPGTDPQLKEQALIYSAHWDHLGKTEEAGKPTKIWNGAVDNASGAAALLAMAQEAVKQPAKRTQIFLWPAAEEQGLIGSLAYVRNPLWPLANTIADLNLDSMNFVGKTRDIGVAGSERSSLYTSAVQVAKQMGLAIAPSVPDLGGAYFRADHFNFARYGIPAFNVGSAVFSGDGYFDFVDQPEQAQKQIKGFKTDYHTEADRYHPEWNLSGMTQQAQFTLNLGYAIANAKAAPSWNKGDPYGAIVRK